MVIARSWCCVAGSGGIDITLVVEGGGSRKLDVGR